MAASDEDASGIGRRVSRIVDVLARAAFGRMLALIADGMAPRDAVMESQAGFLGAFAEQLAAAFRRLLGRAVGAADVRDMPVGDVALSRRLYLHAQETAAEVTAVIQRHAAGVQRARELALQLYDGYLQPDRAARPLEGRALAELPRALRELIAEPPDRASLQRLLARGRAQAQRLQSSALRAGYLEAFDAWANEQGEAILRRKLDNAYREKTRFMASRIAQTELAAAHQAQVAAELMADPEVEVVEVRLNPAHPRTDICDLHARADLFGLGPGLYPKAKAPRPPYHPFCWCRLRARQSLSLADSDPAPGGPEAAARAYLRGMPEDEAARVLGSRARLQAVLNGAGLDEVLNAGRSQLQRLGDVGGHPLAAPVESAPMKTHPDAVPNARNANIADEKLTRYILDPNSERGAHKARLFASILGFSLENADELKEQLLRGLPSVAAVPKLVDKHGARFQADIPVVGPKAPGVVRSGWIVEAEGAAPRLTSAVVLKGKP